MTQQYDIAIIGGGIMGCATALRLAQGGMRCIILERGDLGQGASGVNAGTLSLQIKRVKLMPYARKGLALWQEMGARVGYKQTGGYTLAYSDSEAELLRERQQLKAQAGAPIEFISPNQLRDAEPHVNANVSAASYCAQDGYANSSLTGQFYRLRLSELGVAYMQNTEVLAISRPAGKFHLTTNKEPIEATRLLLAAGGWLRGVAGLLGVDLPVSARVNTLSVTERMPPIISSVIGHATGLLTLKQKSNGSVLIGGGWQSKGSPDTGRGEVLGRSVMGNVALARHVVPKLANARILRSWTGYEAHVADFYPLAGALGGIENAFVLGCVRGGYTIGPYIATLMGDYILEKTPQLPLFDPNRDFEKDSENA